MGEGGVHLFVTLQTYNDRQKCNYLRKSQFDAFVEDSQGEQALLAVIQSWPNHLETINNLIWKNASGECVINNRVPENNHVYETAIHFNGVKPGASVLLRTARGCSFRCAYCSYNTNAGNKLTLMEINDTIAMLKRAKQAGVGSVIFNEAKAALARIFMTVKNSLFVNPIYNFWEIAYLQNKGFDLPAIRQYKYEMNQMTAKQMQQEWHLSLPSTWAA